MVVGIAELLRQPYRDRLRLVGSDKNGEVKWGLGVGKIQTGHGFSYERQAQFPEEFGGEDPSNRWYQISSQPGR